PKVYLGCQHIGISTAALQQEKKEATVGIIAALERAGFTLVGTSGVKVEKDGHIVEGIKKNDIRGR
ncbi:hypothetical protein CHS0354_003821, partial [Potamilus streckersoni]